MVGNGSLWDKLHHHIAPDYVVACVQVNDRPPASRQRSFVRAWSPMQAKTLYELDYYSAKLAPKRCPHKEMVAWGKHNVASQITYFRSPQVDPSRGTCLDVESGLLVNHAYGVADVKVKNNTLVLVIMKALNCEKAQSVNK